MPDTLTPNYHWTKPAPGSSPTTWGTKVNSDLDAIDAQVFTNANAATAASTAAAAAQTTANAASSAAAAAVPIGSVLMWLTNTPPANYFLCDGTIRPNSAAPALAALLGTTFDGAPGTSFGVPDMRGNVPFGVAPGNPDIGTIGDVLSAAIDGGDDFGYVVLNFIVRYQ